MIKVMLILYSLLATCAAAQHAAHTYQWVDSVTGESVTCERCPPGTHVLRHCTSRSRTECSRCPDMHYTEHWNYVERCLYCSVFCSDEQYEKVQCSPEHARVCECRSGFYYNNGFCSKHTLCPAGEGVLQNGTAEANVKCAPCPEGYFSSKTSSTESCQKQSKCSANERTIPGNARQDVFCTTCRNYTSSSSGDRAECDRAVIKYVSQQLLSARKQQRLMHTAAKMLRQSPHDKRLSDMLQSILQTSKHQPFINTVVHILKKARLHHLANMVSTWFLDDDDCYDY